MLQPLVDPHVYIAEQYEQGTAGGGMAHSNGVRYNDEGRSLETKAFHHVTNTWGKTERTNRMR